MYLQHNEDTHIMEYFDNHFGKDFKGTFLDIGANDELTISNARTLIEKGWKADIIELDPASFKKLSELYSGNQNVKLHNVAIDKIAGKTTLYKSGGLLSPNDSGLLSSILTPDFGIFSMIGVKFKETLLDIIEFEMFYKSSFKQWDFISINTESKNWDILQQIDLTAVGCKCLCVEHSYNAQREKYINYAKKHELNILLINQINIIFIKPWNKNQ